MGIVGGQTVFSLAEEQAFVQHLLTLADWGFPFDNSDLRYLVRLYLDKQGRKVPQFKENYPGDNWLKSFMKRHKTDLSIRMCQNIARKRVDEYFTNLKDVLKDVPPENIINYDETNLTDDPGRKKCIQKGHQIS